MNRRTLIKSGVGCIVSGISTVESATPINILPPKQYLYSDIKSITRIDDIDCIVTMVDGFSGTYYYSIDGNNDVDYLMQDINQEYFTKEYFPSIVNNLPEKQLPWDTDFGIYSTDYDKWVNICLQIEDLVRKSSFVVATPKICTIIQLQKSFRLSSDYASGIYCNIGSIDDTSVYRTFHADNQGVSEYLLTDSAIYTINTNSSSLS